MFHLCLFIFSADTTRHLDWMSDVIEAIFDPRSTNGWLPRMLLVCHWPTGMRYAGRPSHTGRPTWQDYLGTVHSHDGASLAVSTWRHRAIYCDIRAFYSTAPILHHDKIINLHYVTTVFVFMDSVVDVIYQLVFTS